MTYKNKQRDKVVNYIKELITDKKINPGEKLPSESSITQLLGVSRVTVRRALDELEKEGAIVKLHNRGAFAKNTNSSNSSQLIPLIMQNATENSRFLEIYTGVQDYLSKYNIRPLLSIAGYDSDKEKELILEHFHNGYRYILLLSSFSDKNIPFYLSMREKGMHFVFIDKKPFEMPCDSVTSNNFDGAYQATNYLISQGHKRIAIISGQPFHMATSNSDRLSGYKQAMLQNGIYDPSLVFEFENAKAVKIANVLSKETCDITALFVLSDIIAIDIMNYLQTEEIPMSVFGFDNLPESRICSPKLSTIEQPFYDLGYYSARLLHQRILDNNKKFTNYTLPIKLIIRDSVYPNR